MNAQGQMKVKPHIQQCQVCFAQGPTESVLCLIARGELTSMGKGEAVLVHLSGQIDKSLFLCYL